MSTGVKWEEIGKIWKEGEDIVFISKGCLIAILDNLSELNKEVEELKKAVNHEMNSKKTATQFIFHSENHSENR